MTLILRAYGIGPGNEVIVPDNTYVASWLAISHTGARPVAVEPVEATYNIDPVPLGPTMAGPQIDRVIAATAHACAQV
jgi:dTDP-4-amino-4,6-dideoxygalactose transaminase